MDWNKGYSARYYISVIDKKTRRDLNRLEITEGSISRKSDGLRESADLTCVNYYAEGEQLIRVWLDTTQDNGGTSHTPLFTGLATSPGRDINGRLVTNRLECYSVLKYAQDILLPRGWYAPAGANAGTLIRSLLSVTGSEITVAPDITTLENAIIAESGENNLSMVDMILASIDWRMKIDGYGNISIEPRATRDISARFDSIGNDILEPSLSITYDWYDCPNVVRAVLDDSYAVARDDSPDSPLSTVRRGREVWLEDTDGYLKEGETLAEYAYRMLKEYQSVGATISYDRRYVPDVSVTDLIGLNYPAQGISGIFMVTSQSITLGHNAKTSEEVIQYG